MAMAGRELDAGGRRVIPTAAAAGAATREEAHEHEEKREIVPEGTGHDSSIQKYRSKALQEYVAYRGKPGVGCQGLHRLCKDPDTRCVRHRSSCYLCQSTGRDPVRSRFIFIRLFPRVSQEF